MMILKAPIELKTRTDFVKDHESFGRRLAGNYMLTGIEIGPEELLHLLSSPPEIYIAEGNTTTVVGNTVISGKNEEKLDIINNMLNRIMLSVDASLSYQDRVYITDTLYKLGIRDDKRFMNEVKTYMNRSRLEQRFIDDYISVSLEQGGAGILEETRQLSERIMADEGERLLGQSENSLYQSIMRRLQTGAVYQIVSNFNRSLFESRIEPAQQMVSEQENVANRMLLSSFLSFMQYPEADIYLSQSITGEGQAEEAETLREKTPDTGEIPGAERILERTQQLQSFIEKSTSERIERLNETEGPLLVYSREGTQDGSEPSEGKNLSINTASTVYRSGNTYERQIINEGAKGGNVTSLLSSAVFLDLVKNLYNTGYANVRGSDVWMEFRNVLYNSPDNTLNRLNLSSLDENIRITERTDNTLNMPVSLDYTEFDELSAIQENESNIEYIASQIREMNEMNLENVSRYEQMTEILKQLKPEKRKVSGKQRTRREALQALGDSEALLQRLEEGEGEQEERRREVFTQITRLFPENAARVFNVVEQYLSNPSAVQDANVRRGDVSEVALELMRFQQAGENTPVQPAAEDARPSGEELFYKREERLSGEELTELLESVNRTRNRQVRDTQDMQDVIETRNTTATTYVRDTERTLTGRELEDIEDMVARGVRAQMGTISEQVLSKLEKRLRNEKSRRGI